MLIDERTGRANWGCIAPIGIAALVLVLVLFFIGFPASVDAGERCVVTRGGQIVDEAGPGWRLKDLTEGLECYDVRPQVYEATWDQNASRAQWKDNWIDGRAAGGEVITGASFRVTFHVDGTKIPTIYSDVAKDMPTLVYQIMAPTARTTVQQVYQRYPADQLFGGDLAKPQEEAETILRGIYEPYGIVLDGLLLWKPDFNDQYEQKVKDRSLAAIDAQIAQQATIKAQEEGKAEFARTAATANAEAEKLRIGREAAAAAAIIDATNAATVATTNATRDKEVSAINAETARINADAEAYKITAAANAEAGRQAALVAAVGGPDVYASIEIARANAAAMANWQLSTVMNFGGDGTTAPIPVMPIPLPAPPQLP